MIGLKIVYVANILVAGWISLTSLFAPKQALGSIFENSIEYSQLIRLVGALWFAIFILSVAGLVYPNKMSLVLVFQLIYKSTWLILIGFPAIYKGLEYPKGMTVFFIVWVLVLLFVIPWKQIFTS